MGLFGEIIAERNESRCTEIFDRLLIAYSDIPEAVQALTQAKHEFLDDPVHNANAAVLRILLTAFNNRNQPQGDTQMSTTTITPSKTFTRTALVREQNRRAKPKAERSRSQSWVFGGLDNAGLAAVLAGDTVEVQFASGRVEHVALSA